MTDLEAGYDDVRNPLPDDVVAAIAKDCYDETREIVGSGYVPDYYRSYASGFVQIVEAWYRRGVEAGRPER